MTPTRPHTKDYTEQQRDTLGVEVVRARRAMRHSQRAFARLVGISRTSLFKLEKGIPVGADVYEAVGRCVPSWTEDTPRGILEGRPPSVITSTPAVDDAGAGMTTEGAAPPDDVESPPDLEVGSAAWLVYLAGVLPEERYREVRDVLLRMLVAEERVQALKYQLAECQQRRYG